MNDIIFSNGFRFNTLEFDSLHYTDNRQGAPSHFFAYMVSGSCKIVTESESITVNEGEAFYIPDKCEYQSYWYGEPNITFISLGFPYLPNFEGRRYPVQKIKADDRESHMFLSLGHRTRLSAEDIGVFYTLVGMLLPKMQHSHRCRTREIVELTHEYLIEHPHAKPCELAKNCAISEAALYSAFKKASAVTLSQLRCNLLLEKARDMLITTDRSIEYISDYLGFSSSSYFRKKFKEHFDMTPKEVRKRYRI